MRQINHGKNDMIRPNDTQRFRPENCASCREKAAMLQALDFALQETVLYLDAYPNCMQALDYYHSLIEQKTAVLESYEKTCGPVSMYGNQSRTSWDWVKGPWPWEPEAN